MKLGEVLVQRGLIDRRQLKESLDSQLIYGGHLGTCLIEKGYLDEHSLGQVLSETFRVPYARKQMFEDIPRFVVNLLPVHTVEKYAALPFRLKDKVLDVALVDPNNLAALDELTFAAGFKIRPFVAPEARVFQGLERYYAIPRRLRFIALCRQLDEESGAPRDTDIVRLGDQTEYVQQSSPTRHEAQLVHEAGISVSELPKPPPVAIDFDLLAERLCRADTEQELADAVLEQASEHMACCILFAVRGSVALPIRATGVGLDRAQLGRLSYPIISEPVFGLLRGKQFYRGPVPSEPSYKSFYEGLRLNPPAEALIVPVYRNDRLVGVFYGDGGSEGPIRGDTHVYCRVLDKLARSLQLVELKRDLRSE